MGQRLNSFFDSFPNQDHQAKAMHIITLDPDVDIEELYEQVRFLLFPLDVWLLGTTTVLYWAGAGGLPRSC